MRHQGSPSVERKLRITHVITGLGNGGAENVLYRLCMENSDVTHSVISLTDDGLYGDLLRQSGVFTACLNLPRGRVTISALLRLRRLLSQQNPDVVQTWMYHADLLGGVLGRLTGNRPVVWNIRHSELIPGKSGRSTILVARICSHISNIVPHKIVVCGSRVGKVHEAIGYDKDRMVLIPNGYDLGKFRPNERLRKKLRRDFGVGLGERLIGFVARFDPQKDHETLFKALGMAEGWGPRVKCILVGPGMDNGNRRLGELIGRYGLQEKLILLGPRDDVPSIMAALDLHVMSSSFGEGFPNVLAEAMACGTPCVTTDVGDARVIVGETGWIVPLEDPVALANAMFSALTEMEDPVLWRSRRDAARERIVQNFSLSRMSEAYRTVWGEVSSETGSKTKE